MATRAPDAGVCGACEGTAVRAPVAPQNRPGRARVDYRVADWWRLRATMRARLASTAHGALRPLRTRDDDDLTLALLDAWAVAGDVFTFYQERLLNQALLATADETRSLHELARLIGYAPHPGVAASADLAFTLDEAPGAPAEVRLRPGLRVQSVPGPDESAVVYETVEGGPVRPAWNAIRPRLTAPTPLDATTTTLHFEGTDTRLKAGDGLLFTADANGALHFGVVRRVEVHRADRAVDPDAQDTTLAHVEVLPTAAVADGGYTVAPDVPTVAAPAAGFVGAEPVTDADLASALRQAGLAAAEVVGPLTAAGPPVKRARVFRRRVGIFGNAAPAYESLPQALTGDVPVYDSDGDGNVVVSGTEPGPYKNDRSAWVDPDPHGVGGDLTVLDPEGLGHLYLDATLDGVAAGDAVVLRDGGTWALVAVDEARELSHGRFTVTAKVTRLTVADTSMFDQFAIRGTAVYAESALLPLAETPRVDAVAGGSESPVELAGWYPGLRPSRRVAVGGREVGGAAEPVHELVELATVEHRLEPGGGTAVTFVRDLQRSYERASVRLNANVLPATHGESVFEVLGSGDARARFQRFATKQPPQTHVSAPVPSGAAPTLEVRVNDVLWQEADNLLNAAPDARVYATRVDEAGITHIRFGDGRTGARLPTGSENVRARYRKGLGLEGRVAAGQLSMLMDRPLGVQGVGNPLAAEGGDDPEPLDRLRVNAPLTVRTLDRIVSLDDFTDFARGFAGIAKALAGGVAGAEGVFVTVAGEEGSTLAADGEVMTDLRDAMQGATDPYQRFALASHRPVWFRVAARIAVHPDYLKDTVLAGVEAAWREAFGFAARDFAEPVHASEVVAVAHRVAGVVALDLDRLYRDTLEDGSAGTPGLGDILAAAPAAPHPVSGELVGAELLTLHPAPFDHLEPLP
jgi:predicted phage baseplate assembly protein